MCQNKPANHREKVVFLVQVKINQDSLVPDKGVVQPEQEASQDHQEAIANQEEDKVLQVEDRPQLEAVGLPAPQEATGEEGDLELVVVHQV